MDQKKELANGSLVSSSRRIHRKNWLMVHRLEIDSNSFYEMQIIPGKLTETFSNIIRMQASYCCIHRTRFCVWQEFLV